MVAAQLNGLLEQLLADIDVPDGKYREASDRYNAVGEWLGAEGSVLAPFGVSIFPQGSFALGTAIKPGDGDDYDVDAVCLLARPPAGWTQRQLKEAVGDRLRQHGKYESMLRPPEGGRRCWTIKYADESRFHLDVLPAKPDDWEWLLDHEVPQRYAELAIQITCRDSYDDPAWPKSNPGGYLRWFIDRMRTRFDEARKRLAMAKRAEVHDVPEYEVRTPLQRVVQILKRQRDVMFGDDPNKPISIIITTLAAKAYDNESDLELAYRNIARGMRAHVQYDGSKYVILNPVNPLENFSDRWDEARQARFFEWLEAVEETESALSADGMTLRKRADVLAESFGLGGARAAESAMFSPAPAIRELSEAAASLPDVLRAGHRQQPEWPVALSDRASVAAKASRTGFRTVRFSDRAPSSPLAKELGIRFELTTNVLPPFDVYWQVTNTGTEAQSANDLRGTFAKGGLVHHETALYKGKHSIQAFVVRNGRCVARSAPVFVIVK
jgi:hypothetical protein